MFIGELPLCFLDIDTPDAVTVRLTVNDLVLIRTPRARRLAHLLEIHNHHLTLSTKHSDRRNTLLYRYTRGGGRYWSPTTSPALGRDIETSLLNNPRFLARGLAFPTRIGVHHFRSSNAQARLPLGVVSQLFCMSPTPENTL
jgi:hypothetical protein